MNSTLLSHIVCIYKSIDECNTYAILSAYTLYRNLKSHSPVEMLSGISINELFTKRPNFSLNKIEFVCNGVSTGFMWSVTRSCVSLLSHTSTLTTVLSKATDYFSHMISGERRKIAKKKSSWKH